MRLLFNFGSFIWEFVSWSFSRQDCFNSYFFWFIIANLWFTKYVPFDSFYSKSLENFGFFLKLKESKLFIIFFWVIYNSFAAKNNFVYIKDYLFYNDIFLVENLRKKICILEL